MAIPWNEDDPRDAALLIQNLTHVLHQAARQAHLRHPPTVSMAQEWHRQVYEGVRLPVPYYAGEVRNSDSSFPELYGYEVRVGSQRGVDSKDVPQHLASFERAMKRAVAVLDSVISAGGSSTDEAQLRSVLTLCAYAHGEWVRIQPLRQWKRANCPAVGELVRPALRLAALRETQTQTRRKLLCHGLGALDAGRSSSDGRCIRRHARPAFG